MSMTQPPWSSPPLVSAQTRNAFREALTYFTLANIRDFFDHATVPFDESANTSHLSGERRTLVEQYHSAVKWSSPTDVRTVLDAYEAVLIELSVRAPEVDWAARELEKLTRLLNRDGLPWQNDKLSLPGTAVPTPLPQQSAHFDSAVLRDHIRRIESGVVDDPALAIGSAKELVESVSKMVLEHHGEPLERKGEQFPQLLRRALACLELSPSNIDGTEKLDDASRKVLGSLAGIAQGMAEIRNSYGTGHGRATKSPIKPRHAMLMVGAAATVTRFMIATYEDRLRLEKAKKTA